MPIETSSASRNTDMDLIPRLLDCRGACAALGGERPISRATLHRLTKAGLLKVYRLTPGMVRWSAQDIADYLNTVATTGTREVTAT